MATTYEAIATVTVGSGTAATMSFTSIPGTYTDLVLKISGRSTSDNIGIDISFNGASTNQSYRRLRGDGSAASSTTLTSIRVINNNSGATASTFGNTEVYIPNYAGSNNKSVSADGVNENNATEAFADLGAGLWSVTDAITSITLTPNLGNFAQYSTATLYGIKNS
jgi:hypothetical protein